MYEILHVLPLSQQRDGLENHADCEVIMHSPKENKKLLATEQVTEHRVHLK